MQKLWEDIIPEEDRKKIDEEEEALRLAELNLGPRERKQIQNVSLWAAAATSQLSQTRTFTINGIDSATRELC